MSKYIDADALKTNVEKMEVFVDANDFEHDIDYRMLAYLLERIEKSLLDIIDNMEAADVAPVAHSEWDESEWDEEEDVVWKCKRCGTWNEITQGDSDMNFCPHCGARMVNA